MLSSVWWNRQHCSLTLARHAVLVQSIHLHTVVEGIQGNWLHKTFSTSSLAQRGSSLALISLVSLPSSLYAHYVSAPSSLSSPGSLFTGPFFVFCDMVTIGDKSSQALLFVTICHQTGSSRETPGILWYRLGPMQLAVTGFLPFSVVVEL